MGFSILPRNRLCSIIISGFWLGFRGLSPYSFGILFHHHFLFPSRVPGLVSLLFWSPVLLSFPGSGACLPTRLASCSIIISWFWLRFQGLSPYSFGILFHYHVLLRLGFRGLCPYLFGILFHHHVLVPGVPGLVSYSFGILFHHHFLVPARVPGLVSLLFWHSVPSSCPASARVPWLVSLFLWHSVLSSVPGSG